VFLIAIGILPGSAQLGVSATTPRFRPGVGLLKLFTIRQGAVIFERRAGASLSEVEEVGSRG
jgi:hypothetical protein